MKKSEGKIDELIHDLKEIGDYFMEQSGGCIPTCIPDTIEILEAIKKLKEI